MLPSVVLAAGLLLGSSSCDAQQTATTASVSDGPSPHQTTTAGSSSLHQTTTAGPSSFHQTTTAGPADAMIQPTPEPQTIVTLDQVVAELSELYRDAARAASVEPLAELAKTLADVHASVAAVSGRLDSMAQWQSEMNSRLNTIQSTVSKLGGLEERQNEIVSRLASVQDAQSDSSDRFTAIQSTLSALPEWQAELPGALSGRFDALEASQARLSGRVDSLLQREAAATVATGPAAIQGQLDAIEAAISLIPKSVLGRACVIDTDCSTVLPEAQCGSDGLCSCRDGYRQVSNTECRRHSRLSEVCVEPADCQALASNATCALGVCSCLDGLWNHNNTECRRVSAVGRGGLCVGDRDCASDLRFRCVSGTCSCPVTTFGEYEYRLVGGSDCTEGNVELSRNGGAWGRVCDDDWGSNDAKVVCRSLGLGTGSPTIKSHFGRGIDFYMDNVDCSGGETHLTRCSYRGWGKHNCGSGEVAGVECYG